MGVEESPYSSLSVFAALKAFSYDIIDRLPLLGTLQNRVLLSFHKIPFLHNVHATDIINILFIFLFFCKQLNETTKLAHVSTEEPQY